MSNYQIGAFEALEWAWHMLRSCKGRQKGTEEARRIIHDTLLTMGGGEKVDFSKKLSEVNPAH